MLRRPPNSYVPATFFPYTALIRSGGRLELKTCDLSRCPRRLQPRFEEEVERRLRRAAEAREAGLAEHLGEPRLTGLRAQHHAAALGDRVGAADRRRRGVVQPRDGREDRKSTRLNSSQ